MTSEQDPIDDALKGLLPLDLDELQARRIRRAAHVLLAKGAPSRATKAARWLEPLAALAVAATSLYWVVEPIVRHYR
jgi:hypothetical protein